MNDRNICFKVVAVCLSIYAKAKKKSLERPSYNRKLQLYDGKVKAVGIELNCPKNKLIAIKDCDDCKKFIQAEINAIPGILADALEAPRTLGKNMRNFFRESLLLDRQYVQYFVLAGINSVA